MSSEPETSVPAHPPLDEPTKGRRELVRPTGQRVLAGVASGLADYWGVSAGWIRVAFLVLSVFGGSGVLLYLGLWVIVPRDDGTESILESAIRQAREGESWLAVALITLGIVIAVSSVSWIDGSLAWAIGLLVVGYLLYQGPPFLSPSTRQTGDDGESPTDDPSEAPDATRPPRPPRSPRPPRQPRPRRPPTILGHLAVAAGLITLGVLALADAGGVNIAPHHYIGAALAVVALALSVGAWFGRAKWLILIGLLLLPAAAISRASDVDSWFSEQQLVAIETLDDLNRTYIYDAGDVVFDLRGLAAEAIPEDLARLDVSMDVGQVTVILPEDIAAHVDASVGIGDLRVGNETSGGFDNNQNVTFPGSGGPFDVSIDVSIGSVWVYTEGTP